jgi:hypothetical protein
MHRNLGPTAGSGVFCNSQPKRGSSAHTTSPDFLHTWPYTNISVTSRKVGLKREEDDPDK